MRLFFICGAVSCSKKTYYLAQIMVNMSSPKIIYSKSIAFYVKSVKSEMDSNEYDYVYLTSRF